MTKFVNMNTVSLQILMLVHICGKVHLLSLLLLWLLLWWHWIEQWIQENWDICMHNSIHSLQLIYWSRLF